MIRWSFGNSLQWFENQETLDLVHLSAYYILSEGVLILLIKLYGFLKITWQPKSIPVFGGMSFSLDSKYIGNPNTIIMIICEVPLLIILDHIEDTIVSCI